jgi:uncharacterized membrane protein YbjE (DUF340 family)
MITVLVLMTLGIILGYFISEKKSLIKISDKLTTICIYLLLFLLGIGVGLNDKIIANIGTIGLQAIIITAGALLGSLILAYFTYKIFFRNYEK